MFAFMGEYVFRIHKCIVALVFWRSPKLFLKRRRLASGCISFKSHKILLRVLGGSSLVGLLSTSFLGLPGFSLNANPSLSDAASDEAKPEN